MSGEGYGEERAESGYLDNDWKEAVLNPSGAVLAERKGA